MTIDTAQELLESIIKAVIKEFGFRIFITALHNTCCHVDCVIGCSDEELRDIHSNIKDLLDIAKKMEGE